MDAVKTTPERYSLAARLLHGLVALLVAAMLTTGVAMTRGSWSLETTFALYQWHKSLGLLVGVAMLARIAVRWRMPPPPLPHTLSPGEARLARAVHAALYAGLIALPVVGWLVTSAAALQLPLTVLGFVDVPPLSVLARLPEPLRAVWYGWLVMMHRGLAIFVSGLVLLHIAGAVRHGRTGLRRMSLLS
jgi:cytochrome b561